MNFSRKPALFRCQPSEVSKGQRLSFIGQIASDGEGDGRIAFYCSALPVSRHEFYNYLARKNRPWKYRKLAQAMQEICAEDLYNDAYGRTRMHQAILLKQPEGVQIFSERTVYSIMELLGLSDRPKRNPNSLTREDRAAQKSEDLLKRDFPVPDR